MCHVLDVESESPADLAGLIAEKDYLLGTAEKVFKNTDILFDELRDNIEKPVEFYVYNSDTDIVRVVTVMPNEQWGGEGILGASVAHGYLHCLPKECCNTTGVSNKIAYKAIDNYIASIDADIVGGVDSNNSNSNSSSSSTNGCINSSSTADSSCTDSNGISNHNSQS